MKNGRGVLYNEDIQLGPFPMERLKHVDKPTILITDNVERFDSRQEVQMQALRGELGPNLQKAAHVFMPERYPLSVAQWKVIGNITSVRGDKVAPNKAPIPKDPKVLSRHIKSLGYFLGADVMGICRFPQYAAYSHGYDGSPIDIHYENAIVMVIRKEYETIHASTGTEWIGDPESFRAYLPLGIMAEVIAKYIKELGYRASPQSMVGGANAQALNAGPIRWYEITMQPLLLLAGIGEVSRTHMILNPFLGVAFKASAVLTNLPLEPDKPIDFGLQDFCQHCTICAEACPVKAIPFGDKVMYRGYESWRINTRACHSFQLTNPGGTSCNMCTKACPWTRPNAWPHNIWRWASMHSKLARRLAIKSTPRRRKQAEDQKWWFDMTYEDGVLKVPPKLK